MAHIFISYDSEDREVALEIVTCLEAAGWSVWWDRRIPTGKTWRSVLDQALEEMDCMLVLWSARSIESHWVIEEAEEGRSRGKLLPLLIESVRPPRGFREIQALSFVDWDRSAQAACFRTLLHDLAALTGERVQAPHGRGAAAAQSASESGDAAQPGIAESTEPVSARAAASATAPIGQPAAAPAPSSQQPAAAPAPTSQPAAAVAASADTVRADRDPRAGAHARPATGSRKLAVTIGIAAVFLLALVPFIDREPAPEHAPPEQIPTPEAVPSPAPREPSSLLAPSSPPLVNSPSSLLGPAPTRDRTERPSAIAPLVQGISPGSVRSTPVPDRFEQQLEERRKQRQAEIERKLSEMKGSPDELARARARMEIEASRQEQAEMTQVLDEMNRQAMEAIRSIKP
jgi:hypothetical protein